MNIVQVKANYEKNSVGQEYLKQQYVSISIQKENFKAKKKKEKQLFT